eukprot:TRINITY_DN13443_c0_g1_i1.p1 TRINITY_DN13443_c0_g1~~TRINITY_DN13443_c0_g1_i1.p1  ORF type:complete len:314 (+),score=47.71 TRINITY_DN13443_c0_g1_i1:193-1134(+)
MPRRPGGKYKGAVTREKGEETLAAEAIERAARDRAKAIQRAQELRRGGLAGGHAFASTKADEEEARKQRILNYLIGGKKTAGKYFKLWIVGVRNLAKEKALIHREASWRRSCGCKDRKCGVHDCQAANKLSGALFELPFEGAYKRRLAAATQNAFSLMRGSSGNNVGSHGNQPAVARDTTLDLRRTASSSMQLTLKDQTQLQQSSSTPQLRSTLSPTMGGNRSGVAPLPPVSDATLLSQHNETRAPSVTMTSGSVSSSTFDNFKTRQPPWLDTEKADIVFHHATGRRCYLDRTTLRMVLCPVADEKAWSQPIL